MKSAYNRILMTCVYWTSVPAVGARNSEHKQPLLQMAVVSNYRTTDSLNPFLPRLQNSKELGEKSLKT